MVGKQTGQCQQQTMVLWRGLQLLGCPKVAQHGVKNGVLYMIEHIDNETVKFDTLEHVFTYDQVRDMMRSAFARTYHSCQ